MDEDFDMPAAEGMGMDDMDLPQDNSTMEVGEEKEIGKEGLKKKLLKQGEGWETPENGDEVEGIFTTSILWLELFYLLLFFCCPFELLLEYDNGVVILVFWIE